MHTAPSVAFTARQLYSTSVEGMRSGENWNEKRRQEGQSVLISVRGGHEVWWGSGEEGEAEFRDVHAEHQVW